MFIKSLFLKFAAAIITLVMLIPAGSGKTAEYDVSEPGSCKLNFTVLSDSHIEGNNFARYQVFVRALQNVKKNKSGNDAIVFLGDNTMNGQNIENLLFHGTVAAVLKGEKVLPVMGNHDIGNGEGDYEKLQNRWYDYTKAAFGLELEHPYYYEVIEGCYFIILGTEAQTVHEMTVTEAQFTWLEGVLELAAESGRPAFVFCHYPSDDAEDEAGNPTDRLTEMLAAYNEEHDIFSFVGHTHMPMYLFWSFHTYDGFPETYLPRITALSGNDDEVYADTGGGVEVERYENEVVIRARDFYRGVWKFDTADDTMCEVTYPLKNPVPADGQ